MTSQVSFKFEGEHIKQTVVHLLKKRLKGFKYQTEKEGMFIYRIYVASTESKEKTLHICRGIQSNAVYDFNRVL